MKKVTVVFSSFVLAQSLVNLACAQQEKIPASAVNPRIALGVNAIKSKKTAALPSSALRDLPIVIQSMMLKGKGVKFLDTFDAGSGMTGYVLGSATGEQRIFYVTPDRKVAILGLMYDQNLLNVTAQHQKDHMDLTSFLIDPIVKNKEPLIDLARRLQPMASESLNGQGLEMFVFVDLYSKEFQSIHHLTRPHLDNLLIRWMPVPKPSAEGLKAQLTLLSLAKPSERSLFLAKLAETKGVPSMSLNQPALVGLPATRSPLQTQFDDPAMSQFNVKEALIVHLDGENTPQMFLAPGSSDQWRTLSALGLKLRRAAEAVAKEKSTVKP